MIEFDFESLSLVGFTPAMANHAAGLPISEDVNLRVVRITEVHRESVRVHDGRVESGARVLPRLARALSEEGTALAVGDWVLTGDDACRQAWIHELVPRVSHIVRRDGDGRSHPIVSNVDTAFLVMGLDDDFNARRLERYLALVHGRAITPVVVLTKADIAAAEPDTRDARLAMLRGRIAAAVDIVPVNATQDSAATVLASYLVRGHTLVLLGSSGAGKSTLTNTLLGAAVQDTGVVRGHDSRGRHTTTSRSLHRLPSGACVIDTPGLRTLRLSADEAALAGSFSDVAVLASRCRFRDCEHNQEPGCAVREGLDADRLRNYHKLLREARRDTLSALDRQRQLAQWKVRGRAVREHLKMKRGE